jgi:hypothetical protein
MAEAENILITLIFFSIIVAAGAVFLTQVASEYSHAINLTENYTAVKQVPKLEALDVMSDINETARSMETRLRGTTNATGIFRIIEYGILFITGIGYLFKLIFDAVLIPFKIVNLLTDYLGIPMYVKVGVITIILIVFLFIIVRMILKREKI